MSNAPTRFSVRAILTDDQGRVLLLQRSRSSAHFAGQWEFPGGKVEAGESLAPALARELQEETALEAVIGAIVAEAEEAVGGRSFRAVALAAKASAGLPRISDEHVAFAWVRPDELAGYDLAPTTRKLAGQCVAPGAKTAPERDGGLDAQLECYRLERLEYVAATAGLIKLLREALRPTMPEAMVEGRAKSIASFAEKILRKNKYADPMRQISDLCGVRVVVSSEAEVLAVGRKIRELFEVDEANSRDALSRLRSDEFGYRSVHYVVRPDHARFPAWPTAFAGRLAEIQVRTWLQHALATVDHDRVYKSPCGLSDALKREKARLAAQLESVDAGLQCLGLEIDAQHALLGAALDASAGEKEQMLLATLRRIEPDSASVVLRQLRLATGQGAWAEAAGLFREYLAMQPRDLEVPTALQGLGGYALCRHAGAIVSQADWRDGHRCLMRAVERDPRVAGAWIRLGEVRERAKQAGADEAYRRAYELDPTDPAALVGLLYAQRTEIAPVRAARLLVPIVRRALSRYAQQMESGLTVAADHFRAAWLRLLVADPHDLTMARESFLRGLNVVRRRDEITDALAVLAETGASAAPNEVMLWTQALQLVWQARLSSSAPKDWLQAHATAGGVPISGPVVLVAGSCDSVDAGTITEWEKLLAGALNEFHGTVISGGTTAGVPGIVGSIGQCAAGRIRTLGYAPSCDAQGSAPVRDARYSEIRPTSGQGFSPLEPVHAWIDLLAAGIAPATVTLLGLGGGEIAAFEYRLALVLGAKVIVVTGTGGAADALAGDKAWHHAPMKFTPLPQALADTLALEALLAASATPLSSEKLDELGAIVHKAYLADNLYSELDPVRTKWADLREDLKESNRDQIASAVRILATEGYAVMSASEAPGQAVQSFPADELERMAEREHARWNLERLRSGWRYGPKKEVAQKLTPYLVPWSQLTEEIKGYDRAAIRGYAAILGKGGLAIVRA